MKIIYLLFLASLSAALGTVGLLYYQGKNQEPLYNVSSAENTTSAIQQNEAETIPNTTSDVSLGEFGIFPLGAQFGESTPLIIQADGSLTTDNTVATGDLEVSGTAFIDKLALTDSLYVAGNEIVDTSGRIPGLTVDYFTSLDGSAITGVNADHVGGVAASSFVRADQSDTAHGALNFTAAPGSSNVGGGPIYINPIASSSDYTLFGVAVNGTEKFKVDTEGDVNIAGSKLQINGLIQTWPSSQGINGSVLKNDGNGTLSWGSVDSTVIGADSLDYTEFEDTLDLDTNLTLSQAAYTWTQEFTGTTGPGLLYTASGAITSGDAAAMHVSVTSTSTSVPAFMINNSGTGISFRVNDNALATDATSFVVDADGKVGVLTQSPSYSFQVNDTTSSIAARIAGFQINNTSSGGSGSSKGVVAPQGAGELYLYNAYTDGGVGIKTTTGFGGPVERLKIADAGNVVFNDPGNDIDLRIESNNDANLFFTDGGSDTVGIGTNTPSDKLTVAADLVGYAGSFFNDGNLDTHQGVFIQGCLDSNPTTACNLLELRDGDGTVLGAIEGNGAGGVTNASSGSDYAELFYGDRSKVEPGDILGIDNTGQVVKATQETVILGAYSSTPSSLGNWKDNWESDSSFVPVALLGQVRVKVTNDHGPIKRADPIAVSPTHPGIGVKAITSQRIVGYALEDMPDQDGIHYLLIAVYPTWHQSTEYETLPEDLSTFGDVVITGSLGIGKFQFDGVNGSFDTVGTLHIQPLSLGDVEFLDGKVKLNHQGEIVLEVEGSVRINGGVVLDSNDQKPQCSKDSEGTLWYSKGDEGHFEGCKQKEEGIFEWVTIGS